MLPFGSPGLSGAFGRYEGYSTRDSTASRPLWRSQGSMTGRSVPGRRPPSVVFSIGEGTGRNCSRRIGEALELYRVLGSDRGVAEALYNLSFPMSYSGEIAEAQELLAESLQLSEQTGWKLGEGRARGLWATWLCTPRIGKNPSSCRPRLSRSSKRWTPLSTSAGHGS